MAKLFLSGQFKFKRGRLEILGVRDCFTPLVTYIEIQKFLMKNNPDLIYKSAKTAGYNWFKKMAEIYPGMTQTKAIEWGMNFISLSGWGVLKVESLDKDKKKVVFKLENSTLAKEYGVKGEVVDFFFVGLAAGGMSYILKADLDGVETKCIAKGDKFCTFLVANKEELKKRILK